MQKTYLALTAVIVVLTAWVSPWAPLRTGGVSPVSADATRSPRTYQAIRTGNADVTESKDNTVPIAQGETDDGQAPPPITFTHAPPDEITVSGNVYLAATASYDQELERLWLSVNGEPVAASADKRSLAYTWDTTQYPDGEHRISVVADPPQSILDFEYRTYVVRNHRLGIAHLIPHGAIGLWIGMWLFLMAHLGAAVVGYSLTVLLLRPQSRSRVRPWLFLAGGIVFSEQLFAAGACRWCWSGLAWTSGLFLLGSVFGVKGRRLRLGLGTLAVLLIVASYSLGLWGP